MPQTINGIVPQSYDDPAERDAQSRRSRRITPSASQVGRAAVKIITCRSSRPPAAPDEKVTDHDPARSGREATQAGGHRRRRMSLEHDALHLALLSAEEHLHALLVPATQISRASSGRRTSADTRLTFHHRTPLT